MGRTLARKALLPILLLATAMLGGCYYTPYPAYAGYPGYYGAYAAPVVVVGAPYYRGRYWR